MFSIAQDKENPVLSGTTKLQKNDTNVSYPKPLRDNNVTTDVKKLIAVKTGDQQNISQKDNVQLKQVNNQQREGPLINNNETANLKAQSKNGVLPSSFKGTAGRVLPVPSSDNNQYTKPKGVSSNDNGIMKIQINPDRMQRKAEVKPVNIQELQSTLQKKKAILGTVNLKALPDGGAKLKGQIMDLEKQLADMFFEKNGPQKQSVQNSSSAEIKNTQSAREPTTATPAPHLVNTELNKPVLLQSNFPSSLSHNETSMKSASTAPATQLSSNGNLKTYSRVPSTGPQKQFSNAPFKQVLITKPSATSANIVQPPQGSSTNYGNRNVTIFSQPVASTIGVPNAPNKTSGSQNIISSNFYMQNQRVPYQAYAVQGTQYVPIPTAQLPPHVLAQLYAKNPQMQSYYGGRMTQARKYEVQAVTSEAIENLHKALQTCPSESEAVMDVKGIKVTLKPHQGQALAWMLWREQQIPPGGILADDMGLGKTLTILALIVKSQQLEEEKKIEKPKFINEENVTNSEATLVICPASVLHQWDYEVKQKFTQNMLKVALYHGDSRETDASKLAKYNVVLTTYNIVAKEVGSLDKSKTTNSPQQVKSPKKKSILLNICWKRIVLDEAHCIKNPNIITSQAIFQLRAAKRWAVTGTPIHNNLLDVYSLLRFLRVSPFNEYKVWKHWVDNKSTEGQNRLKTLMKSLLLRRTKAQVDNSGKPLISLPPKFEHDHVLQLNKEEQDIYETLQKSFRSSFEKYLRDKQNGVQANGNAADKSNSNLRGTDILVLLLRLRQCCNHLSLIKDVLDTDAISAEGVDSELAKKMAGLSLDGKPCDGTVANIVQEALKTANKDSSFFETKAESTKMKALIKELKEIRAQSTEDKPIKCVVMSQWTSMLKVVSCHLQQNGMRSLLIQGNVTPKNRMQIVNDFNTNPKGPEILLVSLNAGGVGLNLIGGNHVFLVDVHWNPQLEKQACDRVYRIGQEKEVHVHRFICSKTVEEQIQVLQKSKLTLAANILSGTKSKAHLNLEDLKMLFGMRQ